MRLINPSFGLAPVTAESVKIGTVDWRRDPIALFSNSKPNSKELLEGLGHRLEGLRSVGGGVDYYTKDTASRPGKAEMIENIAQKYRAALLALGD